MRLLPVDPQTLLMLLTALPLVGLLLWVFARHCGIAIGLLLGAQVWAVAMGGQTAVLEIGVSVYPTDVLGLCAICVAMARVPRRNLTAHAGSAALLAMVVLTAWSTLRGAAAFGLQAAGNDSRVYFWHFLAITLYLATAPLSSPLSRVVPRVWLATAAAYALLTAAGWADRGVHAANAYLAVDGVTVDSRPVPAAAALVLAQAAMLLLAPRAPAAPAPDVTDRGGPSGGPRVNGRHLAALLFLLLVLLLQHRTVWVATAMMGLAWWVLRPARGGQRFVSAGAGALVLSLTALLYAVGAFGAIGGSLADSFKETQGTRSTFAWRVLGWQDLLDAPRTLVQWLVGAPFGSGYERFIGGGLVTVSPHDYYLHIMLRLGLVGLLALLVVYFQTWRRLARAGAATVALRVVMVGQLVLFVSYSAFSEQAVLLGFCLWQARVRTAGGPPGTPSPGVPDPAAPMPTPVPSARPVVREREDGTLSKTGGRPKGHGV
ncbi:O-antigen ligase family protein [Streptomyces sp. WMMC940]|uniref:O-antigen ligase family protein n=1 Tax=Streptomyces sp. WMMC940 TaxID=3015153 RepID=UPI0022B72981|nr:O-antigen ligase family protein [Streptomyces sp. WMMC940]MCZ7457125.1 O-antigen ligase family protein [Streptomyces sp. WMMC940]